MASKNTRDELSPGQQVANRLLRPAATPAALDRARSHVDLALQLLGGNVASLDAKRSQYLARQRQEVDRLAAALSEGPDAA